jgi:hypothetical protein
LGSLASAPLAVEDYPHTVVVSFGRPSNPPSSFGSSGSIKFKRLAPHRPRFDICFWSTSFCFCFSTPAGAFVFGTPAQGQQPTASAFGSGSTFSALAPAQQPASSAFDISTNKYYLTVRHSWLWNIGIWKFKLEPYPELRLRSLGRRINPNLQLLEEEPPHLYSVPINRLHSVHHLHRSAFSMQIRKNRQFLPNSKHAH